MLKRVLLYTATTIWMLPAAMFWLWGMFGVGFFFEEALQGKPLGLVLLLVGASGITAVVYLFWLIESQKFGSLLLVLFLLCPPWIALTLLLIDKPYIVSIFIFGGPIFVSLMLLHLAWPQLICNACNVRG